MKYTVEYRLWATVEVEADSFDEAGQKADAKWYNAEFEKESGFSVVDGEICWIEDTNGNGKDYN